MNDLDMALPWIDYYSELSTLVENCRRAKAAVTTYDQTTDVMSHFLAKYHLLRYESKLLKHIHLPKTWNKKHAT